uniref:Ig-like domain-containing protein n=1 Tax=Esox lucius TaxID=8010 RepID=A0AAY5JX94_ESOLU
MNSAFLLVLQVVLWPTIAALFTVKVDSPSYLAEFHSDVTMGCRFQPVNRELNLTVIWHRVLPPPVVEVYRLANGQEDLLSQHPQYHSRVRLVLTELMNGWAKLQLSRLRINDSGTYQCLVTMGVADYKETTLTVKASYKPIKKCILSRGGEEVDLVCASEGYPRSTISWKDGSNQILSSNETNVQTPDQLFQVTSKITVKSSVKNNYTCSIVDEVPNNLSAMFVIPDEIPVLKSTPTALYIALGTAFMLAVFIVAVIIRNYRQKGKIYIMEFPFVSSCLKQRDR